MPARDIYLLSPRTLSPETIAVAFAKTSRSPESFRRIAAELSDEKSAQFHEKWVVGYGHASVAEHAVLHLAFENVSRIAIESIESNRLASYTEKSTRYQRWSPEDYTVPPELDGSPLRENFTRACDMLFRTYADSLEPVRHLIERQTPRRENETEGAWDRRIRSQYVDTCRFILPAAANANVGMTANARVIEHMIRKMLSHGLAEVREIGQIAKDVARLETPTLVKYAEASPYIIETSLALQEASREAGPTVAAPQISGDWCCLVHYEPEAEAHVLAAALYRSGSRSFDDTLRHVQSLASEAQAHLASDLLGRLGEHDIPIRELEYASCTFDLIMDQGAYAEFKRHRMMTQTPQPLTTRLGYETPRLLVEAGFSDRYEQAMESAAAVFEELYPFNPLVAQYMVPNGFNRRVLAQFNMREAFHFCRLRAARNAHFSIRRVAQRIYSELARIHPLLTRFMNLPDEAWERIESDYFARAQPRTPPG